jgi:hypothetical protein
MYPRVNYEMTEADLRKIIEACKPTPCIMIGGSTGSSPQENANRAWAALGEKMGFDYMTVEPIRGKGERFFSAVPTENETQRDERMKREADEAKAASIAAIRAGIQRLQEKLDELTK